VNSSDIYLGAIPWVALQIILVAIVIIWPETVSSFLKAEKVIDPSTIELNVPMPDAAAPGGGGNPFGEEGAQNPFETPGDTAPAAPDFGAPADGALPPPDFGAPAK